jgi:hypothetical protein
VLYGRQETGFSQEFYRTLFARCRRLCDRKSALPSQRSWKRRPRRNRRRCCSRRASCRQLQHDLLADPRWLRQAFAQNAPISPALFTCWLTYKLFGHPYEFSKGISPHFLHHVATVHLDGRFACAELAGDLFVEKTLNDQCHYFVLA